MSDICGAEANLFLVGAPGCHCVAGGTTPPWMKMRCALTDGDALRQVAGQRFPMARSDGLVCELVQDKDMAALQVSNPTNLRVSAYISAICAQGADLLHFVGADGMPCQVGNARIPEEEAAFFSQEGPATKIVDCITFVVTVEPKSVAALVDADASPFRTGDATISLQTVPMTPNPWMDLAATPPPELCFAQFPLPPPGPYLCTQGCGGMLTHYFAESYHAFDLRCDVGTPLLSMADGVVSELVDTATASGIHCDNLLRWNAISVTTADGIVIVYVHIQPHSALVCLGDTVAAGQQLCLSGDIGFSPEPHVHIEAHRSVDGLSWGPSVPLFLLDSSSSFDATPTPYIPVAGRYYDPTGLRAAPSEAPPP